MKNYVVAGDYKGQPLLFTAGKIFLCLGFFKTDIVINKSTVTSYELYDSRQHQENGYSAVAGAIGSAAFGNAGFLAGNYTKTIHAHRLIINFSNGKRSLVEVDDKLYDAFIQVFF